MKRRYTINIKLPSLLFLAVVTTSFAAIFVKMSESPSSILSMYRMFLACLLILPCTIKFLPELKNYFKQSMDIDSWSRCMFIFTFRSVV